jgi:hypothetical protein
LIPVGSPLSFTVVAMALEVWVESVTTSAEDELRPPRSGATVIVGPNNAGKSALLREIHTRLSAQPGYPPAGFRVTNSVEFEKRGDRDDAIAWLTEHSYSADRGGQIQHKRTFIDWQPQGQLVGMWEAGPPFGNLTTFLCFLAQADQRLSLAQSVGHYDVLNDKPTAPLQTLYESTALERRLSSNSEEAFRVGLTLNRFGGANIHLHYGQTDEPATTPPTQEYLEALRLLPMVSEQGDGVRSFIGLMLAVITAYFPIVLIDEPEAFLHPPQANLLGRKLTTQAPANTQVFIATHSIDVVEGVLSDPGVDVTVARLTREGAANPLAILEPEEVRRLWSDPLLRYSNVLQGLFHQGVVVCEGDGDCRFYSAVLDALREEREEPPHELLFTHGGGKDRIPMIVRALRAVNVPVVVIADIDVLREAEPLRTIVQELGGDIGAIEEARRQVAAAITDSERNPTRHYVREESLTVLDASNEARLSPAEMEAIRAITRVEDGWDAVKESGVQAIPRGQASETCERLIQQLRGAGVFVVDVGELEGWVREVGRKGLGG